MYDNTRLQFTLGNYEDIVEGADQTPLTARQAREWAQLVYHNTFEYDFLEVVNKADTMKFPARGYTENHTYKDKEDYINQKDIEITKDLLSDLPDLIVWLVEWSNGV